MDYDHIEHNTTAIDDAMRSSQERIRMAARSDLNRTRAGLLISGVPTALIAGCALVGAASAAIMRPHFDFHDIVIDVPKLTEKPFDLPKPVEKPFDLPVPVAKPFDLPVQVAKQNGAPGPETPKPVEPPKAPGPTADATPLPPKTPDNQEKKFLDRPDYKSADVKGRIVKSLDNGLHFDTGKEFYPSHSDANGGWSFNPELQADSDPFIGDFGYCNHNAAADAFHCYVIHDDVVQPIPQVRRTRPLRPDGTAGTQPSATATQPDRAAATPAAENMVNADVDVGGYPVKAMVDTGCSWAMAMPRVLAEALVSKGLATHGGTERTMLADGTEKATDLIVINQITVDGRVLHGVVAALAESDSAPILLGLGALNRLGPFKIENGKIVFTSGQPA
jgi:hypothetical protein